MNYLFKALLMIKHIRNQQEKTKSPSANAKGLEMSGSPDRTSFATFVCLRKLIMCVTNWKKSLESVKDLKRQNLIKEVLPLLLSGSPYWAGSELFIGVKL